MALAESTLGTVLVQESCFLAYLELLQQSWEQLLRLMAALHQARVSLYAPAVCPLETEVYAQCNIGGVLLGFVNEGRLQ